MIIDAIVKINPNAKVAVNGEDMKEVRIFKKPI